MSDEIVKGNSGEEQGALGPGAVNAEGVRGGVGAGGNDDAGTEGVEEFLVALTPKQQLVLREIMSNGNMTEVSRRTGVGRSTIYDWMNGDDRFEAALNAWKRETLRVSRAQAAALAKPCVDAVRAAVEKGDADLAFKVGKSMGVFAPPKVGPDDPGEVKMRKARKAKARKVRIAKKNNQLVEEAGEKIEFAKTIYEIDELIEHLMLERVKALMGEDMREKVKREANQRVLRKGDEKLERIARAIREGSEVS